MLIYDEWTAHYELLIGMYNALTGMGGAGQADTTAADNSATALAVTFTICSLVGAPL
jgi:hypothetical protein